MRPRCRERAAALLAAALAAAGCGGDVKRDAAAGPSSTHRVRTGDVVREYRLDLPEAASAGAPAPLIVALHGGGSEPDRFAAITGLGRRGPAAGFAVAYPRGIGGTWNAGYCCGEPVERGIDDLGFVDAMLEQIGRNPAVDVGRPFATGFSNGGDIAYLLACRRSERFAAIAVGGTGLPPDAGCRPQRPVSILHFHGTEDPYHPYEGGPSASPAAAGAILRSVPGTIAEWAQHDGCSGATQPVLVRGAAVCRRRGACDGGSEVVLCTIQGMGHQWPGSPGVLPRVLGPPSSDLDATAELLRFFRAGGRFG